MGSGHDDIRIGLLPGHDPARIRARGDRFSAFVDHAPGFESGLSPGPPKVGVMGSIDEGGGGTMSRILLKEVITVSKLTALFVNIAGCVLAVTGGDFSVAKVSAAGIVSAVGLAFTFRNTRKFFNHG